MIDCLANDIQKKGNLDMLKTREAMLKQILAMRLNGRSESEDVFERNVMKCTISWKFFCSTCDP